MAELFYREERDVDFFNACERVRAEEPMLSVSAIVSKAVLLPAKSFFLHRREYSSIVRRNGAGLPKNDIKRQLHTEILNRYRTLKEENPDMPTLEITKIIAEQPAPRFYISERRAEDLYYKLLKLPQTHFRT